MNLNQINKKLDDIINNFKEILSAKKRVITADLRMLLEKESIENKSAIKQFAIEMFKEIQKNQAIGEREAKNASFDDMTKTITTGEMYEAPENFFEITKNHIKRKNKKSLKTLLKQFKTTFPAQTLRTLSNFLLIILNNSKCEFIKVLKELENLETEEIHSFQLKKMLTSLQSYALYIKKCMVEEINSTQKEIYGKKEELKQELEKRTFSVKKTDDFRLFLINFLSEEELTFEKYKNLMRKAKIKDCTIKLPDNLYNLVKDLFSKINLQEKMKQIAHGYKINSILNAHSNEERFEFYKGFKSPGSSLHMYLNNPLYSQKATNIIFQFAGYISPKKQVKERPILTPVNF